MEQNDSATKDFNGNKIMCDNIECFASTAELLRPKKRTKVEELSTITIGYIKTSVQTNLRKAKECEYYSILDAPLP